VLTHIDVFLGVAMVMLAVSLLLTIVTQIVSYLGNLRGRQLCRGLAELFNAVGLEGDGKALALKILQHPLFADGRRLAPAISKADLKSLFTTGATRLQVAAIESDKLKEIETWFDATMSRVTNRFTTQTRIVTIIGAFVAAFALQLDAFGLVSRLYADSELRAKLAGAADSMVAQSERILAAPSTFANVATDLVKEGGGLPAPPASLGSRDQAHTWIRGAVPDAKQAQKLTARYDELLQAALKPAIENWLGDAANIQDTLAGAGFQLVPHPYRLSDLFDPWVLLGVLTSGCLLSLGAPFWFNTLRAASNLRPAVAATVQSRDDAEKSKS
jgi:hypothetical protein